MTHDEALALFEAGFWREMTLYERAKFQLFEPRLCMPFSVFHEALEHALGRPVWTHELALNFDGIKREFMGDAPRPTFEEIAALIPPEKRLLLYVQGEKE